MAVFEVAEKLTGGNEGGYANNPSDAGGETYKGIARNYWKAWRGWQAIETAKANLLPQPTFGAPEYRNWTKALNSVLAANATLQRYVSEFYKANFWDKYRLTEVHSQDVANWLYDHAVNGGARGVMWIQEALNDLGAKLTVDGGVGPKTLDAINAAEPGELLRVAEDVAAFYRLDRAEHDPSQVQFLPSWLRRDGVSEAEIREVMQKAKDGLTYTEVVSLKEMIAATA